MNRALVSGPQGGNHVKGDLRPNTVKVEFKPTQSPIYGRNVYTMIRYRLYMFTKKVPKVNDAHWTGR